MCCVTYSLMVSAPVFLGSSAALPLCSQQCLHAVSNMRHASLSAVTAQHHEDAVARKAARVCAKTGDQRSFAGIRSC